MARIFKRGENWGIDFAVNGRRIRQIVGRNKAIALSALQKNQVLISENKFLDVRRDSDLSFKQLVEKYIEIYLKPNRPTWWKAEKHNLKHLTDFFGDRPIGEVSPMDVEAFRQERLKFVGKNTVNKNVACLRAMFNKAIEWGIFSGKNPVTGVKFYKVDNRRLRFLEKEEIARLYSHCYPDLKNVVEFAINTGMRRSEIFGLKWHDIDFKNGLIFILKTKNGERREVPMNEAVKNIFIRVRKDSDSLYVFSNADGQPLVNIKRRYNTALKMAGITEFCFHDLRHTFASQLVMNGVDLLTVKELLGHKRIEMTLRYSHLSCDHKKRAVQALCQVNGTNMVQAQPQNIPSVSIPSTYEQFVSGWKPDGL